MELLKVVYSASMFIEKLKYKRQKNMTNKCVFLGSFFIVFFYSASGYAQGVTLDNYLKKDSAVMKKYILASPTQKSDDFPFPNTSNVFLKPFNKKDLPFFCRIEYDMIKQKNIPVKFRLGDVQYVDQLEGKH